MSDQHATQGTRFRLFPQSPFGTAAPRLETVSISSPPGAVAAGPSDRRAYTVVPHNKPAPYGVREGAWQLPPWNGGVRAQALPDRHGHFDHLEPGTLEFEAAHLFGTVRFVLDVWDGYLGAALPWHFAQAYERIELAIIERWPNAHMGFGYLEVGELHDERGQRVPHSLNFDIIAHEVGHAIVMGVSGDPGAHRANGELQAFHEASADFVALLSALHFATVRDEVLSSTYGNLDGYNRLSRFAEISRTEQVRMASNGVTLHEFVHGWDSEHELSIPLLGAWFDALVDIYHAELVRAGLIHPELEELADAADFDASLSDTVQRGFAVAFNLDQAGFDDALERARDICADLLLRVWRGVSQGMNTFDLLARMANYVAVPAWQAGSLEILQTHFLARGIGAATVGPRLRAPDEDSHGFSARFLVPAVEATPRYTSLRRYRAVMPEHGL